MKHMFARGRGGIVTRARVILDGRREEEQARPLASFGIIQVFFGWPTKLDNNISKVSTEAECDRKRQQVQGLKGGPQVL